MSFSEKIQQGLATNLLTEANYDAILRISPDIDAKSLLKALHSADLLTQANFDAITSMSSIPAKCFLEALEALHSVNLLTRANFDAAQTDSIADAIRYLDEANLLTQVNLGVIKSHPFANDFLIPIEALRSADILTQANFDSIGTYISRMEGDVIDVWGLISSHLLTQPVFDQLIERAQQPHQRDAVQAYVEQLLNQSSTLRRTSGR